MCTQIYHVYGLCGCELKHSLEECQRGPSHPLCLFREEKLVHYDKENCYYRRSSARLVLILALTQRWPQLYLYTNLACGR